MTIGTAETPFAKNRHRNRQPVASKDPQCPPVLRAIISGQHFRHAKRTPRADCRKPLEDGKHDSQPKNQSPNSRKAEIIGKYREHQETHTDDADHPFGKKQESGHAEIENRSGAVEMMHGWLVNQRVIR